MYHCAAANEVLAGHQHENCKGARPRNFTDVASPIPVGCRIASVRLQPIARFLLDAVVAKLPDQPIGPVSRRPRLVAKRQLTVFGRKFGNELARRCFRGVDLAEIANVPTT
jgi:hypothetical protein